MSHTKKWSIWEVMDLFIDSVGQLLSQCIRISNHQVIHFKNLTTLFVNYASIKLEEIMKNQVSGNVHL